MVLATAVIVISLIVQGLTLEPLVRLAGIARPGDAQHEETVARLRLAEAALAGWTSSPTVTAPPMTRSTGPGPACRPGSGAPGPGSTATRHRSRTG